MVELIGGRERREIRIVAYDPSWPSAFAIERSRVERALGARARRIEHIGSTSVPGLAAKPIIDAHRRNEAQQDPHGGENGPRSRDCNACVPRR